MTQTARARQLRREMTDAEKQLWRILRDRRFSGYKFRRQHPLGKYYLDFYCPEAALALEVDGAQHGLPDQQARDQEREAYIASRAILVKRDWNHQIRCEPRMVRENLWRLLQERAAHAENLPVPQHTNPRLQRGG